MGEFKPTGFRVDSIVARVVAPAEDKFDGNQTELRLAVGHGYKDKETGEFKNTGATFVTYIAGKGYGEPLKQFGQGDLIEIVNNPQLVTRNYEKDGEKRGIIEVRFGDIVLLEAKGDKPATGGSNAAKGFG